MILYCQYINFGRKIKIKIIDRYIVFVDKCCFTKKTRSCSVKYAAIRSDYNQYDDIIKIHEYGIEKPGSERLICSLPGCFYDDF